jgi:ABC-type sugar transport system substrate-binding protein
MAETVPDGAQVGILSCFPGQFPQIEDRVRGAKSQWEGKNYDIVATLDAQCDNAKGRRAMADLLTAHSDVDAVFSVSDSQTIGALSAIKQAGKDVTIVSYDAQPTVVEKVKTGDVAGTVDIDLVRGGKEALRLAAAAARGEDHEKMVNVPPRIINKDNVDEFEASAG